jgi:predicted DNA binding CopG/RHH family protein
MTTQCQQILANGNPTYTSEIERLTSRLANHIAPLLHQMTSMKGLNYQQLAIEKLLKQLVLQGAMPDVVMNSK